MADIRLFVMERESVVEWRAALSGTEWIVSPHKTVFDSSVDCFLVSSSRDTVMIDIFTESELGIELTSSECCLLVWPSPPPLFSRIVLGEKNHLAERVNELIQTFGGRPNGKSDQ